MPPSIDLTPILALPVADRREIIDIIEDSIEADELNVGLTDAQKAELDRRLEDHRQNPDDVVPWDEVKRRLQARRQS